VNGGGHLWGSSEIRNLQDHAIDTILRRVYLRTGGAEHIAVEPGGGVPQVMLNRQLAVALTGDIDNLVDGRGQEADDHPHDGYNQYQLR
jgi:hypothetical protein